MRAKGLDDAQRARIVRALGLYDVPGAGGKLVKYVGGKDDALREAASDALEHMDAGSRGTRDLGKLLGDGRVNVRRAAVRALVNQGRHLAPLVPALQGRLTDADYAGLIFERRHLIPEFALDSAPDSNTPVVESVGASLVDYLFVHQAPKFVRGSSEQLLEDVLIVLPDHRAGPDRRLDSTRLYIMT